MLRMGLLVGGFSNLNLEKRTVVPVGACNTKLKLQQPLTQDRVEFSESQGRSWWNKTPKGKPISQAQKEERDAAIRAKWAFTEEEMELLAPAKPTPKYMWPSWRQRQDALQRRRLNQQLKREKAQTKNPTAVQGQLF